MSASAPATRNGTFALSTAVRAQDSAKRRAVEEGRVSRRLHLEVRETVLQDRDLASQCDDFLLAVGKPFIGDLLRSSDAGAPRTVVQARCRAFRGLRARRASRLLLDAAYAEAAAGFWLRSMMPAAVR